MNSLSLDELARYYGHEHAFEMQRFFRQENEEHYREEENDPEENKNNRDFIQELRLQAAIERFGEDYEGEEMEIAFSPPHEEEGDEEQKEGDLILVDYEDDPYSYLTPEQRWRMEQQRRALHPEIEYDYDGEIEDDYWNDPAYKEESGIEETIRRYEEWESRREFD